MIGLKTAITIVEIIIAIVVAMALGDYLGYKVGRKRLATALGIVTLAVIVLFTVFAAVILPMT
jgi:hypothetical protein